MDEFKLKNKIKKTVIFVGYECNNLCTFCLNSNKRNKIAKKSTKEIFKDIIEAKKNKTTYIEFIGGEVTIRNDFFKIIKFANKIGFETIMIATNGRMFSNKKFATKAIECGLNSVIFSLHGQNAKMHDSLTGVLGSFEQLIRGIKNVQNLENVEIGTNTTIVKQNYNHLLDIAKLIHSFGIYNAEFIFVDPTQGAPNDFFFDIVPTYEEVSKSVNDVLDFGNNLNKKHWQIRYYPMCFVKEKFHNMISENNEKKHFLIEHIANDFVNKNITNGRQNIGRTKIEKCKKCKYQNLCEGYWKFYVKKRGLK